MARMHERPEIPPGQLDVEAVKMLHDADDGNGYINFTRKDKGGRWVEERGLALRVKDLSQGLPGLYERLCADSYATVNTMQTRHRKIDYLRTLCTCYADIDGHKHGLNWMQTQAEVLRLAAEEIIPYPSVLVSSGRGIYGYWKLRPGENTKARLGQWDNIQRAINERLKHIGADHRALDAARVLRIPGSTHTGAGERVKAFNIALNDNGQILDYTLDELEERLRIPYIPGQAGQLPTTAQAQRRRVEAVERGKLGNRKVSAAKLSKDIPPARRGKEPARARMFDLVRLAEGRGGIVEGYRHNFLLAYALCLSSYGVWGGDLYQELAKVNAAACNPPQPAREVMEACQQIMTNYGSGTAARPMLRNDTIAGWLDVTSEEAGRLDLKAIMPAEERKVRERDKRIDVKRRKFWERQDEAFIIMRTLDIISSVRLGGKNLPTCRQLANHLNIGKTKAAELLKAIKEGRTEELRKKSEELAKGLSARITTRTFKAESTQK